jgi:outer membrane autotransporter protein
MKKTNPSGTWTGVLGNLEIFNNNSGGDIDVADGIAGDSLTISGTFVSNGGSLHLDAVLDDGSSPQADVLYLDTVTPGTSATLVYVRNAGGLGALTNDNRIVLIDADADNSNGLAFTLGEQVIAGAYQYSLYYDALSLEWYLQSSLLATDDYPAALTGALLSFNADWGDLHERLKKPKPAQGEIEPAAWTYASTWRPWAEAFAARQSIDGSAAFDQSVTKLKAGLDREVDAGRGTFLLGFFAGYGRNDQDFETTTSRVDTEAALAGAYAGYSQGRVYGEALLKYEHQWSTFSGAAATEAPFAVDLLGGSLEAGVRLPLGVVALIPHARLSYAHAWAGSFEDSSGVTIDLSNTDSLRGEIAARFESSILSGGLIALDAGLRHEFLGEQQVEVSGLTFSHELPGTSGFIAAALNLMLDDTVSFTLRGEAAGSSQSSELNGSVSFDIKL